VNHITFTYLVLGILPALLSPAVQDLYRTTLKDNSPLPLTDTLSAPEYHAHVTIVVP
jgi:hypothetical protein